MESFVEALANSCNKEIGEVSFLEPAASESVAPSRYCVKEILSLDEEGVRHVWSKVSLIEPATVKDTRAEYLAWRVWFMKQRRSFMFKRSENLGEVGPTAVHPESNRVGEEGKEREVDTQTKENDCKLEVTIARCPSPFETSTEGSIYLDEESESGAQSPTLRDLQIDWENTEKRRHIVLISMHGLVRGMGVELGRDDDTGDQVEYVVELAKALAQHPGVYRVDLLTRLLEDPAADACCSLKEETLLHTAGKHGGAYILRAPCGPSRQYLRKEHLWPYVYEFADNAVEVVKKKQAVLEDAGEGCELYAVHGHYADGGEVAALMAHTLGVDMVMTGHSLGRNKLDDLLKAGSLTRREAEEAYNISRRIEGEERALDVAAVVISSSQEEIDDKWTLYDGYDTKMQELSSARHHQGHRVPIMTMIPPGLDFTSINAHQSLESLQPTGKFDQTPIYNEISRFLVDPKKPPVLVACQPNDSENVAALINAFGACPALRGMANLVLILGSREKMDSMGSDSRAVLQNVLKLVDDLDLYGSVAYPKRHSQSDMADIYSLATSMHGVFVSMGEKDLTIIEAAGCGIPVISSSKGCAKDIVATLHNGKIVDEGNLTDISTAIVDILMDECLWDAYSKNGVQNIVAYSWAAHCSVYMESIEKEKRRRKASLNNLASICSGSWDEKAFKENVLSMSDVGHMDVLNNDLIGVPGSLCGGLGGGQALEFDWGDWMVDEEISNRQPRITTRNRAYAFSFDNQASARTVLHVLKVAVSNLEVEGGPTGVGVVSMLSFDVTCSLIEQEGIDLDVLDFIVCSAGVDVFVWAGGDMVLYDPFDAHIDEDWDKSTVQSLLDRIPNGAGGVEQKLLKPYKDVHGSSDFGPCHILMELSKGAQPAADEVALSDLIKRKIRRAGVRANIVLQVDESPRGATTVPIVHVTPLRACRSQALRFLMCQVGIPMSRVTIVCGATSLVESEGGGRRRVGFAVSDMSPLLEGSQRVIVMPPNKETQVREPKDGLDAKMIEKLKYEIGRNLYGDRVVMIDSDCARIEQKAGEDWGGGVEGSPR
ncbi:hypothetical protein BSKO_10424 [Bryopsis sp. KO-2023]|nr:hypothetical protein BSKO_10424 [Bryopsis sp. KO-2023]